MPSTRNWRCGAAIARDQRNASRGAFRTEVINSLPRVALDASTDWEANGKAIELSMEADRFLGEHGFGRWGSPAGGGPRG